MKDAKAVAFVTYNTVGKGLESGWHGENGRRALLIQNSKGDRWAVDPFVKKEDRENYRRGEHAGYVAKEIGNLWDELQGVLPELDHVVVYVGASGSETAIALASQLPASKVTFVGCDCRLPLKEMLIQVSGLGEASRVLCECGGHSTMKGIFDRYMETGIITG